MKKLFKSTDAQTFVFEDEQSGQLISNPLWNPEMTSYADPERYGFKVWDTGGGCTAHGQEFDLDGKKVVMLLTDGNLHHIDSETVVATAGLYDENTEELPGELYWEVTR
jgi:hypothetical protein